MNRFKAAIFDMDGLLLDSERLALVAFEKTCSQFELGDQSITFNKCIGTNAAMSESILKQSLEGLMDDQVFAKAWNKKYASLTTENPIPQKSGAKALLEHLKTIDVPIALATSTKTESAKTKLDRSDLLHYFDFVVGGDQVTNSKPAPEIYLKAASSLSIDPENCLAFEDSPNGVKSAIAAGMTVVQIPDLIQPDEALLKLGHIILDSLVDVLEYDFST